MPELPEVETTMRGIAPHIQHQKIKQVTIRQYQLRWPIPQNMHSLLLNSHIIDLTRRGKYLLLQTERGYLLIHLGMSGRLRILLPDDSPRKHDHVDIHFHNGKILRFTDARRFGCILWIEGEPNQHPLLKHLGIEPLTSHFSGKHLWSLAQGKTTPIKNFIMNNKIVTGIGNIYAAEALFAAGIHPATPAKQVPLAGFERLVKSIKHILRSAIKQGGTTLKDFTQSDGNPGYFATRLHVYGRHGLPCSQCRHSLQLLRLGQRSTVFCEFCQLFPDTNSHES